MLATFKQLVASLRAKPYSLLDFTQAAFDADMLDFEASVEELESALQRFINQSFESIASTEQALGLLKKYQAILQREALREDLEKKLTVVFHNYGLDLETSQLLYERHTAKAHAHTGSVSYSSCMPAYTAYSAYIIQLIQPSLW